MHTAILVCIFAPDTSKCSLGLLLDAFDQFAVGGDEGLLGFDLGDNGLLRGQGRTRRDQPS